MSISTALKFRQKMIRYADDFEMYENEPCFGECRKVKILVQECFRNYNTSCEQEMCLEE